MHDEVQDYRRATLSGRHHLPVILVLGVGLLLTLALFLFMRAQERALLEVELTLHAAKYANLLQSDIDRNLGVVRASGALYEASDFVEHDKSILFFDALRSERRPGEILSLAWAPRVLHGGRDAFEVAARAEGLTDFQIVEQSESGERIPAGQRAEYFPLHHLAPLKGHKQAVGFDIASEAVRREALERAHDSGENTATEQIFPAGQRDGRPGVLVLRPVYTTGPLPGSVEARREALRGFIVMRLDIRRMVKAALASMEPIMLNITIHDESAPAQGRLLHAPGPPDGSAMQGMQLRLPLHMPGREWAAVFTPNPKFLATHRLENVSYVLLAGLLVTALSALLVAFRKHERSRIEQAHHEWLDTFDAMHDLIFLHDHKGRLLRANRAYAERAGLDYRQLVGRQYWQVFPKQDGPLPGCREASRTSSPDLNSGGSEFINDLTLDSGEILATREYAVRDDTGRYRYSIHVMADVTAQRRAQEELREMERSFRAIVEAVGDGILVADARSHRFIMGNRAICAMLGYRREELSGLGVADIHPREALTHVVQQFELQLKGELLVAPALPVKRKDGSVFYADITSSAVMLGEQRCLIGVFHDITVQRQLAHRKMLEERRLATSLQFGRMLGVADQEILDLALEEVIRITDSRYGFIGRVSEDQTEMIIQAWSKEVMAACAIEQPPLKFPIAKAGLWAEPLRTGKPLILNDYTQPHPGKHGTPAGHVAIQRYLGVPIVDGERLVMIVAVANKEEEYDQADAARLTALMAEAWRVMQRNRAEQELHRLNRLLISLSHANGALVHAVEEDELLRQICEIIVRDGGFLMAWVGYTGPDRGLRIMAHAGDHGTIIAAIVAHWPADEAGDCLSGRAVRTGEGQVVNAIPVDPDTAAWERELRECGIQAAAALPLFANGEAFGALTVYAGEPDTFTPAMVTHLEELAGDLAYGLQTLRIRGERDQAQATLGKALMQTIEAVARIAEMRDPYTAGHQRRVATLAVAIAVELGLSEQRIEGIRVGALIHDIGKITVPAEILSRSGRLADVEFSIIKGHTEAGHEIMKGVSFPWPVLEMIIQHHERMDGSGYPHGLKGRQIVLEARIVAIADVVEAMTSHRPYRPALGIEQALAEIEQGRGLLYDPAAVDACLRLFRDKGFSWQ